MWRSSPTSTRRRRSASCRCTAWKSERLASLRPAGAPYSDRDRGAPGRCGKTGKGGPGYNPTSIAGSSNGRTPDSGSGSLGSNPSPAASESPAHARLSSSLQATDRACPLDRRLRLEGHRLEEGCPPAQARMLEHELHGLVAQPERKRVRRRRAPVEAALELHD